MSLPSATPAANPRQRRLYLAILLVPVAIACSWMGYELNWIQQRRNFIARGETKSIQQVYAKWLYQPNVHRALSAANRPQTAPGLLWLFGEQGRGALLLPVEDRNTQYRRTALLRQHMTAQSNQRIDEAERLFPEAKILTTQASDVEGVMPYLRDPTRVDADIEAWAGGPSR